MERNTNQRRAIKKAIEDSGRPMTPLEVLESAQALAPGIGIATIYRALKSLAEEKWLVTVELPGEATRYELAGKAHHHHFCCRQCKKVFEMADCHETFRSIVPEGFKLESHEIILYGLCDKCAS
ncbi:MAG: transcriptional repressor [Candidatus Sumerlaeaceae bacterium]|nr:transcriptional repressor [Candidatus Sumerlaeaceae bacterium]